jgi:hypothetical protein
MATEPFGLAMRGLGIPEHDRIEVNEAATAFTYKAGGANGTVVCTLTLTYHSNGNVATVQKS